MASHGMSNVDLAIVGAGAAGLGAARRARELGLRFVVLEAMERIGGRAFTDPTPFGLPWDRGCHWLHSAAINPFRGLADRYGFRYRSEEVPERDHLGDRWATDEERQAIADFREAAHGAVAAAGEAGRDVPIVEVVDLDQPLAWSFRLSINGGWGVDPAQASTLDAYRYRDTDQDWPVEDGYGALVARHAAGLPVTLATPVERIEWDGDGVRLLTRRGTVAARAALLTVSTNVLAAEVIDFAPALPAWKLAAAAAVPLGAANKVALQIDGRLLGVEEHTNAVVRLGEREAMFFQLRPFGWDLASGYLSGPLCSDLERAGETAMVDYARQALRTMLGSEVDRHVGATACSTWEREPWIRGAYAAARPGGADQRAVLARPIAEKLFFAGEATSPDFFSTCHGAHLSGIAAVDAAAAALGAA